MLYDAAQGFGRLDAGSRAGFTSSRPPLLAIDPGASIFLISVWCVALRNLGVYIYGHTYSKSMDQPGKVANPARGQLHRENEYFPVRVRA